MDRQTASPPRLGSQAGESKMAQYKFETLAQQDVNWYSKDGKSLVISIKLVQESMDYFGFQSTFAIAGE